jgi:hypothetical protein
MIGFIVWFWWPMQDATTTLVGFELPAKLA